MTFNLKNNQRLIIKEVTEEDASDLITYMSDVVGETPNLLYTPDEWQMTLEGEKTFIKNLKKVNTSVMYVGRVNGEVVTVANLQGNNKLKTKHRVELAISVKKAFFRLNIATYMMETLINKAKEMSITKINLGVFETNKPAIYLYKKFGFKKEGSMKRGIKMADTYQDLIYMGKCI
ncbi:MAG: GNAT family N-acetyltransferase [Candidatus Izimaplasma sp.]|nr:GNAT family N-acetyltransferase [Candidatus Izimaplasma bacterium]